MASRKKAVRKVAATRVANDSWPTSTALPYRGSISGLDAIGASLVFSTEHDEGQPTGIFAYDLDAKKLTTVDLDCGVTAQLVVDDEVWIAGTDGSLRHGKLGTQPEKLDVSFEDRVVALAGAGQRIAVVAGESLHLVDPEGGVDTFDLGEPGRTVASDPSSAWIVVGTSRGHLVVFNDDDGFSETSRGRLHDGEVTALAFAPDELRVYSTGSDCRLLISYVRGSFDSEDRGGNNMHERAVNAIQIGPDFESAEGSHPRFFTTGLDGSIKSWPRARTGSQRPSSWDDGVVQTAHMTAVTSDDEAKLAVAGLDGSIRLFGFDEQGRVASRARLIRDAYVLAESELQSSKPKERQAALRDLAGYADRASLDMISTHLFGLESDHKLQVEGVELVCGVDHRVAPSYIEGFFQHQTSDVRIAAFDGLLERDDIEPLTALRVAATSGFEDLGVRTVEVAAKLGNDAAVDLIEELLDHSDRHVRLAALSALERHHGASPEGTLAGLKSQHADIRRTAIVQLQRRSLLGTPRVDSRLRRLWDDDDQRTRLLAFVVATHRSESLVKALRYVNEEFHRQVFELEEFGKDEKKRRKEAPAPKKFDAKKLTENDFRPLLEAMGSRSIDVCLRGASGLASLGDERAFGTLLQLSREGDASARVTVCKSLRVLADPRSIKRVRAMLHDPDGSVRDAAFTALDSLQADDALATARAGLAASATDVRERALALLVNTLRGQKEISDEGRVLLMTALNDDAESLRLEAFKSTLNLEPEGPGAPTLRFILQSVAWDVRREVLQEAKAHPKDEAYRAVVIDMIDDEAEVVRGEAFTFALDRWPSSEHERIYRAGLTSRHVQMRTIAVRTLAQQKGEERGLLVEALDDETRSVRLEAVRALVQAENRDPLANALDSEHVDVRVEAATALAALGDARALEPLLAVIDGYHELLDSNPTDDQIATYKPSLETATKGLQQLGHPDAIDAILSLVRGEDAGVAVGAAAVLPGIAHPSNLDQIRDLAKHENANVRQYAALALAYNGDASSGPVVFGEMNPHFQLFAALGLREHSQERLLSFVDSDDGTVRNLALALVLLLELSEHTGEGVPERCLALLSAANPYIRLAAAEALEHYGDQPRFYEWVYEMLNGLKSPADAWKAEPRQLLALSRAVTFGEPRLAVRAGQIVAQLMQPKGDDFEQQFRRFEERFSSTLAELEKVANQRSSGPISDQLARAWHRLKAKAKSLVVDPSSFGEALHALAFGAYVGLARQQHATNAHQLRAAAISGLARLAPSNDRFRDDSIAVLLLALGDPNQTVRERAFETLQTLGCADDVLSTEALSTGFSDMGFRGLELLAADPEGGNALLEQTLIDSTNGLETEAAKLLAERVGWTDVYRIGLGAAAESFRARSVRGLAERYGSEDSAANGLREALDSRHDDVRFLAARELAIKKDVAAYDTLIAMLETDDSTNHHHAITALETLRDARTPAALLDRVENAEDDAIDPAQFLSAAARFNDASIGGRLLALIDADRYRPAAFEAALQLTGYKQYEWADDDEVTPSWEESLDPRHPDLFSELFDLGYRIADTNMLSSMVGLSKWPPEDEEVDRTLAALLTFTDDNIRHRAVEIVGWRLRNRGGPADGLRQTLSSDDPLDQFYAAEGLALAGHDDGLPVLRTAVDAIDDWSLRERAVLALGRLAEPTTVDMLLELANDDAHYLQKAAAEAIGHMSESERADEVFSTLQRLATSGGYDKKEYALRGLRWFGSPAAWDILRRTAKNESWWIAQKCVELLRFDEASLDVIIEVLRENDDWDVANTAVASLRHIYGPDSLEPDYLLMQASVTGLDEYEDALGRIRERGDAERILDVLAKVPDENTGDIVPGLVAILLGRDPLPVAEAASMLSSDQTRTATVAAQIVGRAGSEAAKEHGDALTSATTAAREAWLEAFRGLLANRRGARERVNDIGERYRRMVWAAGQVQVGEDEILAAARLPDHEVSLGIREEAVATLGESWFGSEGVAALVELAQGRDARLRSMAAAELDRAAPEESAKLIGGSLHDDVSFGRLLSALDDDTATTTLRDAVGEAAGIALPRLAALGDVEGLTAAMQDSDLGDATRRGAIDALGTIVADDVADRLAAFGSNEDEDELLRKAAWRARRRVTRALSSQRAAQQEAP